MHQTTWLWAIPLLPLAGFVFNIFLGRRLGKGAVKFVGCATVLGAFAFAVQAFLKLRGLVGHGEGHTEAIPALTAVLGDFIVIGNVKTSLGLAVDPLSAVMTLVVTGVGFLIHLYSTAYMADDARFSRYFAFLNLFTAMMLLLILGDNLLLLFLGWEGVGLCSYLLIGFWFEETKNAVAGMKAFLVNRVGDFGFTIGVLLLFVTLGTVTGTWTIDFATLQATFSEHKEVLGRGDPRMLLGIAGILLFVGACGKSAQLPLYVWLPDAMAGPTPVSALIHAATMVTAGIYMVARMNFVFQLAPVAGEVVATVGVLTALFAATIALVQTDIKKVLAYSTVSQLGYMFLGVGVGATAVTGYSAGIFHVMTHAFFKACLFLGAGSVIHAMHHALPHGADPQDVRNMGGLRRYMPVTAWTFLIATLAIAGFPPLAGFFSKDEILWRTFETGHHYLWFLGACAAGLTAFYMLRILILTFFGIYKGKRPDLVMLPPVPAPVFADVGGHGHDADAHAAHDHTAQDAHGHAATPGHDTHDAAHGAGHDNAHDAGHGHASDPHETPAAMTVPLVILATLAVVAGFLGLPAVLGPNVFEHWMEPVFAPLRPQPEFVDGILNHHQWEWLLMFVSVGIATAGALVALLFYVWKPDLPGRLAASAAGAYRVLRDKYYVDELYQAAIVRPLQAFTRICARFDLKVIDGFVDGFARFWRGASDYTGWVDNTYVDGAVNGTAGAIAEAGRRTGRLQTGRLRGYLTATVAGAVGLLLLYNIWAARDLLLACVNWLLML